MATDRVAKTAYCPEIGRASRQKHRHEAGLSFHACQKSRFWIIE